MKVLLRKEPRGLYSTVKIVSFSVRDLALLEVVERHMPSGHANSKRLNREYRAAVRLLDRLLDDD